MSKQQSNDVETAVAKALEPLIQALSRLNLQQGNNNGNQTPFVNNYQNSSNQGFNQNRRPPIRTRPPVTCYKYNQVGYIARNCLTNAPQQNNQLNQGVLTNNQNMYGANNFYAQQMQAPQVPVQPQQPMQQFPPQQLQPPQQMQPNHNQNQPAQVLIATQDGIVNQPTQQIYPNEHLNFQTHP